VREHLTEAEMDKLLAALKRSRHGRSGGRPGAHKTSKHGIDMRDVLRAKRAQTL
jgi:hypothetical protein